LTISGKKYRNAGGRSYCYYDNRERWPRNKYTLMHGRKNKKLSVNRT